MAYTAEMVDAAMIEDGQVAVTAGKVEEIDGTEAGTLVLSVSGRLRRGTSKPTS